MPTTRLSPWDLDVAPDEDLPNYEASTPPAYSSGTFDERVVTYHLRQYDRKIQMLLSYDAAISSSYRITTNSFKLFSKKPDMEVLYTSQDMQQRNIAEIRFDNDGPLPWCPRANFNYTEATGAGAIHKMESRNFTDWTIVLGEQSYEWSILINPSALVLKQSNSDMITARFTYSECGTQAVRGAEVGELTVFRDGLTQETGGADKVVCSFMVALTHLKKMGRCYRNPSASEAAGVSSVPREQVSSYRAASVGSSVF